MPLQPVNRRSVPDEVFDQLVGELTGGELGPGQSLPSERRLAEVLGVSRPAVREALQRLAQAGLVDVRQGGATTVRDFRQVGGLELLPRLLFAGGNLDLSVARSILEARLHVGPRIAALAAERGGADLADALDAAVASLAAESDPVARQRCALVFWDLLVDGAESITFRLMFNSMRAAYEPALEALAVVLSSEVDRVEAYRAVAKAVAGGNARLAERRAAALLTVATDAVNAAIDDFEGGVE
ncbi:MULTISPECIES: FadR/GntR family transcriptional regulator [unclassified Nocardioides]|uniref:FadR/GntR family transcriptional regulator n=1 Tax=unclassified Nocardioides TaxID=2615069 RepID=UPI0006FB4446|nr:MULTISPECIES: GntR family transcriptional regulator [unclassified Nocardioides]KQY55500.1 GntR family transcriptional regulator [Nocardioides sp. Root140]KRF12763.1 GntR family transcriptional regulator [Nocardioides sp. Soil796]